MISRSKTLEMSRVLKLSDDGFILIDDEGEIDDINNQAGRMLGIKTNPFHGLKLNKLSIDQKIWAPLIDEFDLGQRSDLTLSLPGGRRLLASLRRDPNSQKIGLIQLCDLEVFDYRRGRATGSAPIAKNSYLASNKTRPDYEMQRRLSPQLHQILSRGERAIQRGARILITGETGVGKTEVARFLHYSVSHASDPFVVANCAMTPAAELNSLLFGTENENDGLIFKAVGGTLFLDEVAEIPPSVQARLVGFLDNCTGFGSAMAPNFRIISATNADLQARVNNGLFRADLYYRLSVIGLSISSLRQMPSLINHLIDRFLMTINHRRTTPVIIPERLRSVLEDYSFPGNIRELLNIVQKVTIFMEDAQDMEELINELIAPAAFDKNDVIASPNSLDLKAEVRRFERALIDKAIRIHGSKRKAAKALGVDIGTISRKTAEKLNEENSTSLETEKTSVQLGANK